MKTFLNKKDIDNEIDLLLNRAEIINNQASLYVEENDLVNANLFLDLADRLLEEVDELKELRKMLFAFCPEPIQEYHFIQGNNRVEEMVVVVDLN